MRTPQAYVGIIELEKYKTVRADPDDLLDDMTCAKENFYIVTGRTLSYCYPTLIFSSYDEAFDYWKTIKFAKIRGEETQWCDMSEQKKGFWWLGGIQGWGYIKGEEND